MFVNAIKHQNNIDLSHLVLPVIGTCTSYGNRYTTVFDYKLLNDKDLELFTNKTAQRTVKLKRAEKMAKDYFNILTRENELTHDIPFQSSFVFNLNLKEHGLSEADVFKDGNIHIPVIKHILSVRDGGHRKVASTLLIMMLQDKIDTVKNPSKRAFYEHVLRKFLDISFTVDIYVELEEHYSKRCLLDLGKSEPVSPGREFYFIHNEYADAIEYLSDSNQNNIYIDLDSSKYSKYNGLAVPLNYVSDIIQVIGGALYTQGKLTAAEINDYIINFLRETFSTLTIDTFSFKNSDRTEHLTYLTDCKMNFFNAIKRLLSKEIREVRVHIVKEVVGADVLFSKLTSKPKREVLEAFADIDLIDKFNEVKEFVLTDDFKTYALAKDK